MSRFLFLFFLSGLDKKIEKKKEKEREKIYHIITMMMKMMFFFHEKYTTGNAQDSEKKCADGLSDFDFIFPRYLASCDDYTYL